MSDENTTPQEHQGNKPHDVPQSGSRWEPRYDVSGVPTPPVPPAEAEPTGAGDGRGVGATAPLGGARPPWTSRVRGRGGLLVGAAALVLVSGVGGFAVGEVAHHPDGGRPPFGVGYQPQDAQFPGLPPGAGEDDGGLQGHDFGQDDGGRLGGQLGGGSSDDGGAQQGSSL